MEKKRRNFNTERNNGKKNKKTFQSLNIIYIYSLIYFVSQILKFHNLEHTFFNWASQFFKVGNLVLSSFCRFIFSRLWRRTTCDALGVWSANRRFFSDLKIFSQISGHWISHRFESLLFKCDKHKKGKVHWVNRTLSKKNVLKFGITFWNS